MNISTRLNVQTGDNAGIGGFIVTGSDPQRVLIRAIGPSMNVAGTPIPGRLEDPVLELHDQNRTLTNSNDNWKDAPNADEIRQSGLAPTDDREAAILRSVPPGSYTAIIRGKAESTGIGLVEVYSLIPAVDSQLANISTRGVVQAGDNVMIGGFIVGNNTATTVIRAIGPSLKNKGLTNPLDDPMLEIHDGNGNPYAFNDDWQSDRRADEIQADQLAPADPRESATKQTLAPGNYTAIVRGKNNSSGAALIEIYNVGSR
jgi:hypothetical protein